MADANIRNFFFGMALLAFVILGGTYVFSIVEGVNLFDSFFYMVLFVTTIGAPYFPLTTLGKVLVMLVVGAGMGLVFYIVVFFASNLIEGQTRLLLGGIKGGFVKMRKEKNHIIVCGYGKLGKYVCNELKQKKQKYLIIDKDADKCASLVSNGESVLQGDVLDQKVLKKASIDNAKGLIATLGEDSDNIYLIITATEINPSLHLAAKAEEEHAVDRLHKIGAKIVVLPQVVGGRQLANAFLDLDKSEELETVSTKPEKKKKHFFRN